MEQETSLDNKTTQIIEVWTNITAFPIGKYIINKSVKIGDLVNISIGSRKLIGVVKDIPPQESTHKLKIAELTGFHFSSSYVQFLNKFEVFTLNKINPIISSLTKLFGSRYKNKIDNNFQPTNIALNKEQQHCYETVKMKNIGTFLLWGITGSGKTEVFFQLINDIIQNKQQVLLLLPEIAITEGILLRFEKVFGIKGVTWNSKNKNKTTFMSIYYGDALVVIGSRSAIFLPFKNLKLIIVDEEHDKSYKQITRPIYNCRDMAVLRGKLESIPVILASATPSLESIYNVQKKKYELLRLTERYYKTHLPHITYKATHEVFSNYTIEQTKKQLDQGNQIIFFINRRGFAPVVICQSCFHRIVCTNCEHNLVFHMYKKQLLCHKCAKYYPPDICPNCQATNTLLSHGFGVEKIQMLLKKIFPEHVIEVLSSDICDSSEKLKDFLIKMKKKEISIVVGTQILSKGHDFPSISLVVILGLENTVFDFKCRESLFQNLVQLSGRAGRAQDESEVIIQTSKVQDFSLFFQYLQENNYDKFLDFELNERSKYKLPPFYKIIVVKYISKTANTAFTAFQSIKYKIIQIDKDIDIKGPIFVNMYKTKLFQHNLIIKVDRETFIKNLNLISQILLQNKFDFYIDIDPYDLLL